MRESPLATKSHGLPLALMQLHQWHLRHALELAQVGGLERLDEHRRVRPHVAVARQRAHERLLERQADALEVARMLGFRIHADRPPRRRTAAPGVRLGAAALVGLHDELQHLVERRHLEHAVEARVGGAQRGQSLAGAQRLQLGEREVLGEPAGDRHAVDRLRGLARCELGTIDHVGGGFAHRAVGIEDRDRVLVPRDEHAVLGDHEVGLDVVGALLDGHPVGGQRVFGQVAAGAAVADDQRRRRRAGAVLLSRLGAGRNRGKGESGRGEQRQEFHVLIPW